VRKSGLDSPDSVGNGRDIPPEQSEAFGDNGVNAQLAVRRRGQAPEPQSGASKKPGLRSASHCQPIELAAYRSLHLTLSDRSSADLYSISRFLCPRTLWYRFHRGQTIRLDQIGEPQAFEPDRRMLHGLRQRVMAAHSIGRHLQSLGRRHSQWPPQGRLMEVARHSHRILTDYDRISVCPADRIRLLTSLLLTSISLFTSFK